MTTVGTSYVILCDFSLHTKAEEIDSDGEKKLVYKHNIVPGVTTIEHYGLTLAKNTNLPKTVIGLAEELAVIITKQKKVTHFVTYPISKYIIIHRWSDKIFLASRTSVSVALHPA